MSQQWGDDAVYAQLSLGEDLVTGEAVVLDLRTASFGTRALALALDLVLAVIIALSLNFLLDQALGDIDPAAGAAISLIGSVVVVIGIPVTLETVTRGRTLGKLAAGLRVVRDDGGPIRARQALIRGLLSVVEIYLSVGSIALITSLVNARGKRLGDLLAGTYVIRERAPRRLPDALPMPPQLRGWAAGSDLGRLPDRLALATRQFIGRAGQLAPGSRERLARDLADQVSQYVAPSPPAGTHPEDFLAAVMAERRDRDYRRLAARAQARAARQDQRAAASPLSPAGTRLVDQARRRNWPDSR